MDVLARRQEYGHTGCYANKLGPSVFAVPWLLPYMYVDLLHRLFMGLSIDLAVLCCSEECAAEKGAIRSHSTPSFHECADGLGHGE